MRELVGRRVKLEQSQRAERARVRERNREQRWRPELRLGRAGHQLGRQNYDHTQRSLRHGRNLGGLQTND